MLFYEIHHCEEEDRALTRPEWPDWGVNIYYPLQCSELDRGVTAARDAASKGSFRDSDFTETMQPRHMQWSIYSTKVAMIRISAVSVL